MNTDGIKKIPVPQVIQSVRKIRILVWLFCGFLGGIILTSMAKDSSAVVGSSYFAFIVIVAMFFFYTGRRTAKDNTTQAVASAVAIAKAEAKAAALAVSQVTVNTGEQRRTIQESTTNSIRQTVYQNALDDGLSHEEALEASRRLWYEIPGTELTQ